MSKEHEPKILYKGCDEAASLILLQIFLLHINDIIFTQTKIVAYKYLLLNIIKKTMHAWYVILKCK